MSSTREKKKKLLLFGSLAAVGFVSLNLKGWIAPPIRDVSGSLPRGSGRFPTRARSSIDTLIVHHSASVNSSARKIAEGHVKDRGWPGIGYHYVIEKDGAILQTQPVEYSSYHVRGMNSRSIGICVEGNFEVEHPTYPQLVSLRSLIKTLRVSLPRAVTVAGHRQFDATLCPGKNLYPKIKGL